MKGILLTCLCLLLTVGVNAQQQDGPLTNVAVVKLVKAGFKDKTIISIINSRPAKFKLDTDDLIELKRNGVNEKIILAMLSAQMGTVFLADDEWSGDPFFRDSKKQDGGDPKSQAVKATSSALVRTRNRRLERVADWVVEIRTTAI